MQLSSASLIPLSPFHPITISIIQEVIEGTVDCELIMFCYNVFLHVKGFVKKTAYLKPRLIHLDLDRRAVEKGELRQIFFLLLKRNDVLIMSAHSQDFTAMLLTSSKESLMIYRTVVTSLI